MYSSILEMLALNLDMGAVDYFTYVSRVLSKKHYGKTRKKRV